VMNSCCLVRQCVVCERIRYLHLQGKKFEA
jgi:hypothetical protein